MKKIILALSMLCFLLLFCSCKESETFDPFVHTEVTPWTPPPTTSSVYQTFTQSQTETTSMENNNPTEETDTTEENPTTETTTATETTSAPETTQVTTATETTEKPTEVPTQGVENPQGHIPVTTVMGNTTSEDLKFLWKGTSVTLNEKIDDVFSKVGEDNSSIEISDTEMSYEYDDFTIYTYTDEKHVERVRKIEVNSDNYATGKGVSKGDYASALKRHYGNPVEEDATLKQYGDKEKRLIFTYNNNLITGISYELLLK